MESYEVILDRMKTKFEDEAGFSADDASDIGIRLKVLAAEIYSIKSNIEWLKRELFPQTATGTQLEMLAQERGLQRKAAIKSQGVLTFSISSASLNDISIPKGTICSTLGINSVSFVTKQDAVITQGSLSVDVETEAESGGANSNTTAGTITVLVTQVQGVETVNNANAFTGGTDAETDNELRERLLESYKNISNGTNSAFYKKCALSYDGVYSASVVKKSRGVGTVDVYVAGKGKAVDSSTVAAIQNEINSLRELNVDVQVKNATLSPVDVYFSLEVDMEYDKETVKQACKDSIKAYFDSLKVGDTVYLVAVADAVYHTPGVKNYEFIVSGNRDVTMTQDKLAICGNITIADL